VTTATERLPAGAGRSSDPRRGTFWLLSLPSAFALGLFLILPLLMMIALSFRADLSGQLLAPFTPTLKQFAQAFAGEGYWRVLGISASGLPRFHAGLEPFRPRRSVAIRL